MPPRPLIIPIFIPHQGCPHRCIFCDQHAITAETAPASTQIQLETRIAEHLATAGRDRGPAQVAFYGGNFLGLPRRTLTALLEGLQPWLDRGQIAGIRFSTRPDTITAERLAWIAPYPIETVELGVQSMNDIVLGRSRRGHTAADARRAMEQLQAKGYQTGIQLMLGLPGDTARRALASARAVAALGPDFVRIYPTLVLAGSALASAFTAGEYTPLTLTEALDQAAMLVRLFHQHRIGVIRIGLQAAEGLEDPAVVLGGPHHPAFGHLVYAQLYRAAAHRLLAQLQPLPQAPTIYAPPHEISRLLGHKKANLDSLRRMFARPRLRLAAQEGLACETLRCADRTQSIWQPD